ncbi:hypothetical protein [Candidatus Albibeggiatoa sp. nov. NOAA]|uniref:hypothetical protein n=1 Tax=Candidatus Albibeggiatoa sp. nov. NOAA TaxID=3162724 RepID=UPI0033001EF1|nr:hypothetical protein [Thiotrichaceae bacterium]
MSINDITVDNMTVMGLHLIQEVKNALPIADVMQWLTEQYPQAELKQILAMLNVIYQESDFQIQPASDERQDYVIGDKTLTAYPQSISLNQA